MGGSSPGLRCTLLHRKSVGSRVPAASLSLTCLAYAMLSFKKPSLPLATMSKASREVSRP